MKKFISIILAGILVITLGFGLISCGKTDSSDTKVKVIGINQYGEHPSLDNCRTGFVTGLKNAGLVEGTDFKIDYQNAGFNDATSTQISQSFSSKNVALMVGIATPSAQSCYAAAEEKDIPVIFSAVSDPKAAKLDSGNITGTSDLLPVKAQLDLIKKIQPGAKTIGIIYTVSEPNSVSTIADYKKFAPDYGFEIVDIGVTAQSEVTQAVDTLIQKKVDCFSNLTDNNVVGVLASILEKTNEVGIPVYGSEIEQVKIGCVASAGIDYVKLGEKTGELAAKILKGEAKASEIPFVTIQDYSNFINKEALKEMKLTVPGDVSNFVEVTKD